jgi:hypothetical protein
MGGGRVSDLLSLSYSSILLFSKEYFLVRHLINRMTGIPLDVGNGL